MKPWYLDANKLYNRCMIDDSWFPRFMYDLVTWKNRGFKGRIFGGKKWMAKQKEINAFHRSERFYANSRHIADRQRKEAKENF